MFYILDIGLVIKSVKTFAHGLWVQRGELVTIKYTS